MADSNWWKEGLSTWSNPGYDWSTNPSAARAAQGGGGGVVPNAGANNAFMAQQARAQYEANLPDYANLVAKRSANTGSLLAGQVPGDVTRQIQQAGAERGAATGSYSNASWLQALGLTSLGLQQQGSQNLSAGIADTPVSPLSNPWTYEVPAYLGGLELNAAQAGIGAGRGGGGGGGVTGMPNLSYGGGPSGPASWEQGQGGIFGASGPFDTYSAPATPGGFYNLPTGNTYGGGANAVFDPYFQPGGQGGSADFEDWGDW